MFEFSCKWPLGSKLSPHHWQHLLFSSMGSFISSHTNRWTNMHVLTYILFLTPTPSPILCGLMLSPHTHTYACTPHSHTLTCMHAHTQPYQSSLQRTWSLEQWWWFPQDRPHTRSGEVQPCSCPPRTAHSYYLLCHSNTPADNPLKSMETCLFLQYVLICCVM